MNDSSDTLGEESTDSPQTGTPKADTQENRNAETEEDTASGGAPADPDPDHF